MQPSNQMCFEAFEQLLSRPDPPDLPRRVNIARFDGDPNRQATLFPGTPNDALKRSRPHREHPVNR